VSLAKASGGWNVGVQVTTAEAEPDFVGDFNNDGIPDLLAYPWAPSASPLAVYLGKGDGTFSDHGITSTPPVAYFPWSLGDLDEDGNLDVFLGGGGSMVLLGAGDGTFVPGPSLGLTNSGTYPADPGLYYLNGDGHLDYIETDSPGYQIHVALGNGDGTFQPEVQMSLAGEDGSRATYIAVAMGDLNGDGRPDLIATDGYTGNISVFLNQCR
jgi:hypothetical protein